MAAVAALRDFDIFDTQPAAGHLAAIFDFAPKAPLFDILINDDGSMPAKLEAKMTIAASDGKGIDWTPLLLAALLAAFGAGFLYLNSSINDGRRELQESLNTKASESIVLEMQKELRAARLSSDSQFKSIQASIKADGDMTRDKIESLQRTVGRLEGASR